MFDHYKSGINGNKKSAVKASKKFAESAEGCQ